MLFDDGSMTADKAQSSAMSDKFAIRRRFFAGTSESTVFAWACKGKKPWILPHFWLRLDHQLCRPGIGSWHRCPGFGTGGAPLPQQAEQACFRRHLSVQGAW